MAEDISKAERTKVVQTEVPPEVYERFSRAADERSLTIKEAARAAIEAFADRHQPVDPDDPLFAPLDREGDAVEADGDASERVDELVYGTPEDDSA